jgi:hypothetical protein
MSDITTVCKGASELLDLLKRIIDHVTADGSITFEELRRIMIEQGYGRNKTE